MKNGPKGTLVMAVLTVRAATSDYMSAAMWKRKGAVWLAVAVGVIAVGVIASGGIVAWVSIRRPSTPAIGRQPIRSNGGLPMSSAPRGRRILEQLEARLDRIQELDVNIRSQHLSVHNASSELRLSAAATVSFRRPADAWQLRGKTTPVTPSEPDSGAPFELIGGGKGATLSLSVMNGGRPQPFEGIIPALEALRGVTRTTANVVPDMLLHAPFEEPQWNPSGKRFLSYLAERAHLEAEEAFDGHDCYRVQAVRETGTWTLWIDREALLPRGVRFTKDGGQLKSSGLGLAGRITHMESMHHLGITRAAPSRSN